MFNTYFAPNKALNRDRKTAARFSAPLSLNDGRLIKEKEMKKWALRGFLLLTAFFSAAVIADFKSATEAHKRGDYQTAYKELLPLAEAGNPDAMGNLGNMYAFGQGVEKDLGEAGKWWRKAANKGLATAMGNLGALYARGIGGLPQDWNEAAKWYRQAAENGHGQSMLTLSGLYANGVGVEISELYASVWAALAVSYLPDGKLKDESLERFRIVVHGLSPEDRKRSKELASEFQARIESNRKK